MSTAALLTSADWPVQLFPHQVQAVQWMQKTETRPRMVPEQPHGGILAHAMGLGKTITMLSLMRLQGVESTIVVCPKSVLTQWRDEALRILRLPVDCIVLYHGTNRAALLDGSSAHCRLVLTTFDIVRLDCKSGNSPLHAAHWDRIVLDEAHRICEQSSKTARTIRSLRARNRWCVTGTPFKNGVTDLVALSKFLLVPPYCNSMWWRCHSQNRHKLQEWRNAFLNIMDKRVLTLPSIDDKLLKTERTPAEEVVRKTLHHATPVAPTVSSARAEELEEARAATGTQGEHELLKIMRLRQAANHPLLLANTLPAMSRLLTLGVSDSGCNACASAFDTESCTSLSCGHKLCSSCAVDVLMCPCCIAAHMHVSHVDGQPWRHSAKTQALADYLARTFANDPHAKVVLFSQWTTCLDLLGLLLDRMHIPTARYDGRVNSVEERTDIIQTFKTDPTCKVLLTSLGAGGEGLNLVFANHVILMEPYWNCAAEQQAVDRLHRIGQKRTTHVVRIVVGDSIEDWVQEIQQKKTKELERLLRGAEAVLPCATSVKGAFRGQVTDAQSALGGLGRFLCEGEHKQ
jgi:SNF2 family DNA or RNA helicase